MGSKEQKGKNLLIGMKPKGVFDLEQEGEIFPCIEVGGGQWQQWTIRVVDQRDGMRLSDYEPLLRTGIRTLTDDDEESSDAAKRSTECEIFSLLRADGDDRQLPYQLLLWENGQSRCESQIPALTRIDLKSKRVFITLWDPTGSED